MPKDYKTNVIIDHQVKGVDKLKQGGDRVSSSLSKMRGSLQTLKKEYADTQKALDGLTKALNKQTDTTERLAKKREELASLKKVEASAKAAQREVERRNREEQRRQEQISGAFTQGLVQGGFPVPAMFLQRGPGMGRQLAGMGVGRIAGAGLGMGKAGLAGSFTGVAGLQQFLSSIPYVGGLLAGQVGKLAGYAEQNIGYQKTELGAAPYLSEFQDLRKMIAIGGAIRGIAGEQGNISNIAIDEKRRLGINTAIVEQGVRDKYGAKAMGIPEDKYKEMGFFDKILEFIDTPLEMGKKLAFSAMGKELAEKEIESVGRARDSINEAIEAKVKQSMAKVGAKAAGLKANLRNINPLAGIGSEGARLMGLNKEETIQFLSSIVQAGGGTAVGEQAKGIRETAFGAKTLWGVGAPVSGAFLKAGRRGGLTGGESANNAFVNAINQGISLGLSGSEINTWLENISQGINAFQQTGISINVDSISKLAIGIGKAGLPGTRGIAMAQGMSQYLQGMGSRGITGGSDLIMLNLLGGWKGGGVKGYREARSKMEEMNFGPEGVSGALSKYLSFVGGDQATKAEMLQRLLSKWGVKGSVKEFDWMAAQLTGGPLSEEQKSGINKFMQEQARGVSELTAIQQAGGITGAAAATVAYRAPNVKEMALMQNQQIAIGGRVASTMQSLERNALNTSEAFAKLAEGPLNTLSEAMGGLSEKAMELVGSFTNLIESGPGFISSFLP